MIPRHQKWSVIDADHSLSDPNFYLPQTTHHSAEIYTSSSDPETVFAAETNQRTKVA